MKMKFIGISVLWGMAILGSGVASVNAAETTGVDRNGTVPFPFTTSNQFVELANGETYWLTGIVRQIAGQTFFEIDFESSPWLASRMRRSSPMYRVESVSNVPTCYTKKDCHSLGHAYKDEYVTILARAHWSGCKMTASGDATIDVSIVPLSSPQLEYYHR